jgi:hypothetical protein
VEVNYLDEIASRIREQVPESKLPHVETSALFRIYAVLLLAKGASVSLSDVHNAWVAWTCGRNPEHAALIPFSELSEDVASADLPYVQAILKVVAGG